MQTLNYTRLEVYNGTNWINVTGSARSITTDRQDGEVGLMTAEIIDATLDPLINTTLRLGRPVRVLAKNGAGWSPIFTGTIDNLEVNYDAYAEESKRATISISGVDYVSVLNNQPERRGVGTINALRWIVPTPFNINGATTALGTGTVVATNDNASVWDQIITTRDSVSGYAWVDMAGTLKVYDNANMPTTNKANLTEDVYRNVEMGFKLDQVINSVTVKWLRYNIGTEASTEVPYGPITDEASIAQWGVRSAEFTIQGPTESESAIQTFANGVLSRSSTASARPSMAEIPLRVESDLALARNIDLNDRVTVTHPNTNTTTSLRVNGVRHIIGPDSWDLEFTFSLPSAVVVPTPATKTGVAYIPAGFVSNSNLAPAVQTDIATGVTGAAVANEALTLANEADTKADQALTDAADAFTQANTANTAAGTAQSTASTALTNAANAFTQANNAITAASDAEAAAQAYTDSVTAGTVNLLSGWGSEVTGTQFINVPIFNDLRPYVGKTVTVSFDLKASLNTYIVVYGYQGSGITLSSDIGISATTEYQRYSFTTTIVDNPIAEGYSPGSIGHYDPNNVSTIYVKNYKIEVGPTATAYTPTQADLQAAAAADATAKATAAQNAAVSTAAGDATTKANTAQSTAISTAATDATTKANTAQSTAISTAATDATTKASNAQTAAQTYADSQYSGTRSLVNDWKFTGQTTINGGVIQTDTIGAVQITANAITAKHTLTGPLIQTTATVNRGIKFNTTAFIAYDNVGTPTFSLTAATGAIAMKGDLTSGSTITGATMTGGLIQTTATANRGIKINTAAFLAYDAAGSQTFSIDAATGAVAMKGSLTSGSTITGASVTGSTFSTSGTNRVEIKASGGSGTIDFLSGLGSESSPGSIKTSAYLTGGTSVGNLILNAPQFTGSTKRASVSIGSYSAPDLNGYETSVYLNGDEIALNAFGGRILSSGTHIFNGAGRFSNGLNTNQAVNFDGPESTWQDLTIATGWTAVAAQKPQFRMDAARNIHIRGAVTRGSGTSGSTVFTIPNTSIYYRPKTYPAYASIRTNNASVAAQMSIGTDGVATVTYSGTAPTAVGLECIYAGHA